jgi:hypothetical protein
LKARVGSDLSTPKILTVLGTVGIVEGGRRGKLVFCRLKMPCVLGVFSCIAPVLQDRKRGG